MYELIQVGADTFYIQCPAKMGIYRASDDEVYLIDSGNDKDAGRKVDKIFKEQGWKAAAIINTHSNADHIGGNKLLLDRWDCAAYALGTERRFAEKPILEPSFLYGGYPFAPLRNKFLMAQASESRDIDTLALPAGMEYIELPGHYFDMIGIKTPDDVWFLADCMSGANIIEKYHLSFIYDVRAYLQTLDLVETLEGKLFIPAHAEPAERIAELSACNRKKVLEICATLLDILKTPLLFEEVLEKIFLHYALTMDFNQYVLIGSTVRSYLSYLYDEGKAVATVQGARMLWSRV